MDLPKLLSLGVPTENFSERLKLTILVFVLNSLLTLGLLYLLSLFADQVYIELQVRKFIKNSAYSSYFANFSFKTALNHLWYYCYIAAMAEEFIYRYPLLLMLIHKHRYATEKNDYTYIFLILTAFSLNLIWANGFLPIINGHPIPAPIFISGLPLYWLTAKTRKMWPAVFCHSASNFGLYLLAQFFLNYDSDNLIGQLIRLVPK